jgi:hypothetical protein
MRVSADRMPDDPSATPGTTDKNAQANESGDCQRETDNQDPRPDWAVKINPFKRLDGEHHPASEHAQGEHTTNNGLMPRPPQKSAPAHHLSIGSNALRRTWHGRGHVILAFTGPRLGVTYLVMSFGTLAV